MRPTSAGLLRTDFRFRDHLNYPFLSKNANAAAVGRGYGSMGVAFNSSARRDPLPDLPENKWDTPALIQELRESFQTRESKWP